VTSPSPFTSTDKTSCFKWSCCFQCKEKASGPHIAIFLTVLQLCAVLDMIEGCNEDFLLWFCVGSPDSKSPFLHPANLCRNVSWLRSINSSVIVLVWFLITSFRITAWIGSIYIIINSAKQHDTDVSAAPFNHTAIYIP
jgi:hypothetical protein